MNHLSDEQFAECAVEAPGTEAQAHLDVCAQCREELSVFRLSVGDFSAAAMSWSEAQPSMSLREVEAASRRTPLMAYGAAAVAAGLVLAIAMPGLRPHRGVATPVAAVPEDSAAQIAEDNRMMQTVSLAIGVREPSPFREYQLQDARAARSTANEGTRSE